MHPSSDTRVPGSTLDKTVELHKPNKVTKDPDKVTGTVNKVDNDKKSLVDKSSSGIIIVEATSTTSSNIRVSEKAVDNVSVKSSTKKDLSETVIAESLSKQDSVMEVTSEERSQASTCDKETPAVQPQDSEHSVELSAKVVVTSQEPAKAAVTVTSYKSESETSDGVTMVTDSKNCAVNESKNMVDIHASVASSPPVVKDLPASSTEYSSNKSLKNSEPKECAPSLIPTTSLCHSSDSPEITLTEATNNKPLPDVVQEEKMESCTLPRDDELLSCESEKSISRLKESNEDLASVELVQADSQKTNADSAEEPDTTKQGDVSVTGVESCDSSSVITARDVELAGNVECDVVVSSENVVVESSKPAKPDVSALQSSREHQNQSVTNSDALIRESNTKEVQTPASTLSNQENALPNVVEECHKKPELKVSCDDEATDLASIPPSKEIATTNVMKTLQKEDRKDGGITDVESTSSSSPGANLPSPKERVAESVTPSPPATTTQNETKQQAVNAPHIPLRSGLWVSICYILAVPCATALQR